MKQNEIIEMAKRVVGNYEHASYWPFFTEELQHFAKLVATKEREAIWNIFFEYAGRDDLTPEDESLLKHLADLIRARSGDTK